MDNLLQISLSQQLSGLLLALTVIMVWTGKCIDIRRKSIPLWLPIYVAALSVSYINGQIQLAGLLWACLLALSCLAYVKKIYPIISYGLIVILPFLMATHMLPGYNNLALFKELQISGDAVNYSMYLNIDKISAGILLFWFLFTNEQRQVFKRVIIKKTLPVFVLTSLLVFSVASLSLIKIDVKLISIFPIFFLSTILFTSMTEEAYFRGVVQNKLMTINASMAILVSALLFALAHFGTGRIDYILVAMLAGFGYALVYYRTGSVGASIISHGLLNSVHFIFFTFPYLR